MIPRKKKMDTKTWQGVGKKRLLFSCCSPGDAAVVQPLLSSHDDVEPAPKIVRLHVHDLITSS